jgi:hypothetical protein
MGSNVYLLRIPVSKFYKYDLFSLNEVQYYGVYRDEFLVTRVKRAPDSMITSSPTLNILLHPKEGILGIGIIR